MKKFLTTTAIGAMLTAGAAVAMQGQAPTPPKAPVSKAEMLARAEAHFQPYAVGRQRAAEQAREIDLRGALGHLVVGRDDGFGGQGDFEARQQRVEQRLLPGPQFLAPSTAVQRASTGFFHRPLT